MCVVLCLIVFGCQYQCNWLPGKTCLRMAYYVSSGTLNPTHSLTHSPSRSEHLKSVVLSYFVHAYICLSRLLSLSLVYCPCIGRESGRVKWCTVTLVSSVVLLLGVDIGCNPSVATIQSQAHFCQCGAGQQYSLAEFSIAFAIKVTMLSLSTSHKMYFHN